jgi:5'-3' exonuclease
MFPPSELAKFYPKSVTVNGNGRRYDYEGGVVLPFVEREAVRKAVANAEGAFRQTERERPAFQDVLVID